VYLCFQPVTLVGIAHRQLVRLMGVFIQRVSDRYLTRRRGFLRSIMCFPFSILLLLYFCLAILLWYRMLGDNVLSGGGMWWCRLDVAYCLGIFLYL